MTEEEHHDRRHYEMEIHSIRTDVQWLKDQLVRLERLVTDQSKRQPLAPVLAVLVAGFGVMITLGVQSLNSVSLQFQKVIEGQVALNDARFKHQEDLFSQHESLSHEKIDTVDKQHSEENTEQEEDIQELRSVNKRFEDRLDNHLKRLAVLETKFGRVVGHSKEGFHQKDAKQVIGPIHRRLELLEKGLLGQ